MVAPTPDSFRGLPARSLEQPRHRPHRRLTVATASVDRSNLTPAISRTPAGARFPGGSLGTGGDTTIPPSVADCAVQATERFLATTVRPTRAGRRPPPLARTRREPQRCSTYEPGGGRVHIAGHGQRAGWAGRGCGTVQRRPRGEVVARVRVRRWLGVGQPPANIASAVSNVSLVAASGAR